MFKKSNPNQQVDMFTGTSAVLQGKFLKRYNNPNAWHNLFRSQVYARIDESSYSVLFDDTMGAPNAPVSLLVAMMILKEAYGWSDLQLFEECGFNLLVRSALGLANLDDHVPAESTYYLFRKRVYQHREKTGEDLLQKTFDAITSGQIKDFEVNGASIRMDSKLLGSNIAFYSRYEVIHRTLCLFYASLKPNALPLMQTIERSKLKEICSEDAQKTVYRCTKQDIQNRLQTLGLMINKVLRVYAGYKSNKHYQLLERVFNEHYKIDQQEQIQIRPKEEISSDSLQSPHDPDSAYRQKGDQRVKGYSVNVTETNSDNNLNLITNAKVDKANVSDVEFVKPAIVATQQVSGQTVETVYADGAYQSPANDTFCDTIDMVFTGMQGPQPRYQIEMTHEGLLVTDTQSLECQIATLASKSKNSKEDRYYIITDNKKIYFGQSAIRAAMKRQAIKQRPIEELRKRNNVEATIFQLAYHLRNKKSKYRTMIKQQIWANCRCLWINFVRILKYVTQTYQRTLIYAQKSSNLSYFDLKSIIFSKSSPILSAHFAFHILITTMSIFTFLKNATF